jgi:hypothetical protein
MQMLSEGVDSVVPGSCQPSIAPHALTIEPPHSHALRVGGLMVGLWGNGQLTAVGAGAGDRSSWPLLVPVLQTLICIPVP